MNFSEPTRITQKSRTCIDNIFTNFSIEKGKIIEPGLSDHTAQLIQFTLQIIEKKVNKPTYRRKYYEHNITQFNELLYSQDWSPVYAAPKTDRLELDTVNASYNAFTNIFFSCFEMAFPKSPTLHTTKAKNKNWITKGIIKSSETKWKLFINMKQQGDECSKEKYNKYKKCLAKVIKEAKKLANNKFINKHKNKAVAAWKVVNTEIGRLKSKTEIDKINLNGDDITDTKN